jgi:drug/metabolite transporter (DMT)-like permease
MAFSFTVLAPVAMLQPWANHVATLQKQWRGIVYIGSFMALNIGEARALQALDHCVLPMYANYHASPAALNNLSLLDISLSLSQIIRSAIPVVACILAVLVEHKYPTNWEAGSLAILCLGVMLAVWQGTVTGKPYAILFSISATVSNGLMMTFSSKLMSEKLDVMRLTFYMSPVSLACLVPFFWVFEVRLSAQ